MERELVVNMNFYLTMENGETEEQAKKRFNRLMAWLEEYPGKQDSGYSINKVYVEKY